MGLEGTAAISKLPHEAAPRRAAPVSTAARPPQPDPPIPGRAAANARARRHTQHQAQEAQQQNARGGDPGPRGAAPARASAATCHTYTPAEQADATLMCASAIDYEFAVPAGFHPDEAARALVGGDDAAESARLHASLDAPCKAALKKLRLFLPAPLLSFSPRRRAHTRTRRGRVDGVDSMASTPSS